MLNGIIDRCRGILNEEIELASQVTLEREEDMARKAHAEQVANQDAAATLRKQKLRQELGP